MNYKLLCDIFRRCREYTALTKAINTPIVERRKPFYVNGLTDSAEYIMLTAMCLDMQSTENPVILVFPESKRASSFRDFLSSMGIKAAFFPQREYCFFNITSSHDFEGERLTVLAQLAEVLPENERAAVICTTPEAALQITMSRETLSALSTRVSVNEPVNIAALSNRLVEAGYARVELVEASGQFAVRGGIIDVYPPMAYPVRIELFGDEVDRIGHFSIETQRFTNNAPDTVVFPPVREAYISPETRMDLSAHIRRHLKKLGSISGAQDSFSRAGEILQSELTSLEHGFEISFADKYMTAVFPDETCLLEYIEGPVFVVDSSVSKDRAAASTALIEQSIEEMVLQHELAPQKSGVYIRSFDEICSRQTGPCILFDRLPRQQGISAATFLFNTKNVPAYAGNTALFRDDLSRFSHEKYLCAVICSNEAERISLSSMLTEEGYTVMSVDEPGADNPDISKMKSYPVLLMTGEFIGGYELLFPKFIIMDFSRESARPSHGKILKKPKKKVSSSQAIMSYADLEVGDFVVHEAYGIGQYMGLETLTIDGSSRDYIHINYSGSDKLFLPADQLEHVSKYIGAGSDDGSVRLSKTGGADWVRAKSKAKAATREMAKELIELYARRKRTKGIPFDPDDAMYREFADSFEYEETDGQISAIDDIRADMEKPYPMDRLLCGDVGYGKTEVALRAAFKAVMSGYQVALLVPTTILAYQHYQTFLSRLRSFPVTVDMLSRFRTATEQAATVRKIARGDVDIVIGTHRLISKDVKFNNLGLIIIDEEQRFGVAQKEKLKQIAVNADILTLTATPIPRTLNMAMGGIVNMSVLEEAPGLRTPVQTYVMEHDDMMINESIRRELRRGGQVFYLYNNVEGIYNVADRIGRAVPDARIAVAHGKMDRDAIEDVWDSLIRGEVDILVCTTIIETGIDVPNANTLIIENAENYGLSQLHQIRGRVGRSSIRAFAYFTYRKGKQLTEIAEKRLSAIREYAEFGAGFRIALRDLEIRGAGNLLGAEQHGHLEAVGYDMYMRLLEEAVGVEKGEPEKKPLPDCSVDVRCDAYLTESYIKSPPQRIDMYKRIARIETETDYEDLIDELCDRYGEPDSQAVNLCRIARIRSLGRSVGITKVEERDGCVRLYSDKIDGSALQRLSSEYPALGIKVSLGQSPYAVFKQKRNVRNTEFIIEILEKYASLVAGK